MVALGAAIADIAYQNKAVVYDLLLKASAETVLTIATDPKHLGARIGITAVLHTWGSTMTHQCAHDRAGRRRRLRWPPMAVEPPKIPPPSASSLAPVPTIAAAKTPRRCRCRRCGSDGAGDSVCGQRIADYSRGSGRRRHKLQCHRQTAQRSKCELRRVRAHCPNAR
jgi:hypothetical protein